MRTIMAMFVLGYALMFPAPGESSLKVTATDTLVDIYDGESLVLQYKYGEVPRKPYVMSWFTPKGVNILRDAPHDHLHHHGLMHAIIVDGVNLWEETPASGFQDHQSIAGVRIDADRASFTETLSWRAPDKPETLVTEQRSIIHHATGNGAARLLTWHSILAAPENRDTVTLSGNIYHGVGMRFPVFMDKIGKFRFAEDVTGGFKDGPHYLAQASWCAYAVVDSEHTVTVAMFSAPDNPRPALWFTMLEPFSYLAATLDLSRQPMILKSGETMAVKYGIAAWDGEVDDKEVQAMYTKWMELLKVK
jgi:hypothetical protein